MMDVSDEGPEKKDGNAKDKRRGPWLGRLRWVNRGVRTNDCRERQSPLRTELAAVACGCQLTGLVDESAELEPALLPLLIEHPTSPYQQQENLGPSFFATNNQQSHHQSCRRINAPTNNIIDIRSVRRH